ncbi:MAG: phosphotransferase [Alphaproteobacteria bacterium]|jgi:Ser/Thr protein kinase RdoA (MazF antagonist)|nr:phosphotransferase [Alphaproteobacteria bacterium]
MDIDQATAAALRRWDLPPGCSAMIVNRSENTTFRVDDPDTGGRWALRLHRSGYHSTLGIASELAWMTALRRDSGVLTSVPVPGRDGELIQDIASDDQSRPVHCVLFEWIEGTEPDPSALADHFVELGEISARMHRHARGWTRPAAFERLTWDHDTALGARPHWGRWQDGLGLTPDRRALLERLSATLRRRLESFGKGPDRFGLIHADIRLANLLVAEGRIWVIDFDDCGFGWYLYDCAAALSFIEDRPDASDLIAAWLEGYRRRESLSTTEAAEIPTFVMLRRLLLLAWIGSHSDTDLARQMGAPFADGTCGLAETYLASFG